MVCPAVPPELGRAQHKFGGHAKKIFSALRTGVCAPNFKTVSAPMNPVNSLPPPLKLGLPLCHFNVAMNVDYDWQMVRSHILTDWPLHPLSNVRMCHSNVRWTEAPSAPVDPRGSAAVVHNWPSIFKQPVFNSLTPSISRLDDIPYMTEGIKVTINNGIIVVR